MVERLFFALYRGLGYGGFLLVWWYLKRRRLRGKEHESRWRERLGYPGQERPEGRLLWLHAASIGESLSALPLIAFLARRRPEWRILVTTGTVTSAALLEKRLPAGVVHQFVPVDLAGAVERFYRHWQPDVGVWLESELWPHLLRGADRYRVPLALINARMSQRSLARWRRFPKLAGALLGHFSFILAQSPQDEANLRALGAVAIRSAGNLKSLADPLPVDEQELGLMRALCAGRPLWLAACTHPGEEAIIVSCHERLAVGHPGLITVIVPRHPERGAELAAQFGLARRATGAFLPQAGGLYLADRLGELGLWYRLAPLAFIGGSLFACGGHNPLEAMRLGCAVLHGPHMDNFAALIAGMKEAGAVLAIADGDDLFWQVHRLLLDEQAVAWQGKRGQAYSAGLAAQVERMVEEIAGRLDQLMAGARVTL